jgi:hypothetical protein
MNSVLLLFEYLRYSRTCDQFSVLLKLCTTLSECKEMTRRDGMTKDYVLVYRNCCVHEVCMNVRCVLTYFYAYCSYRLPTAPTPSIPLTLFLEKYNVKGMGVFCCNCDCC